MNENTGKLYGYIRVSTKEQNEDRQRVAMHEFGIADRDLYMDKQSGKDFERPNYKKLVRKLKPGDTLVIKSIDRLGRNYDEIIEQWRTITKQMGCAIVVLDMPLLDTRRQADGLTGAFIADLVLQVLSYVAQIERENIRQRQAEGIALAKARGVRFGRPAIERPKIYGKVSWQVIHGELSRGEAARASGVSVTTFEKWMDADNPGWRHLSRIAYDEGHHRR